LSKQNLLAIDDLPTPLSPKSTILASMSAPPFFLCFTAAAEPPCLLAAVFGITFSDCFGWGWFAFADPPQHPPDYYFSAGCIYNYT